MDHILFLVWQKRQRDKKDMAAKKKASALAKKDDATAVVEKDNQDVIEID